MVKVKATGVIMILSRWLWDIRLARVLMENRIVKTRTPYLDNFGMSKSLIIPALDSTRYVAKSNMKTEIRLPILRDVGRVSYSPPHAALPMGKPSANKI